MSRDRITVTREGGEVVFEATIRWNGTYSKATHLDPEEFPEPEIDEVWRTVGDGPEVKLRPDFIPDDVADEILAIATSPDAGPADDEPEPDLDRDDPREDDRNDRDFPF